MSRLKDITGERFGQLVVTGYSHSAGGGTFWLCDCDCGTRGHVAWKGNLVRGMVTTCGCSHLKANGMSSDPTYRAWIGMKVRCYGRGARYQKYYRDKGISVCDRWRTSFENFLADMGMRPSPKHSIDRVDGNGSYEPGNCRWATAREQAANTSQTKWVTLDGERVSIGEAARRLGLPSSTLRSRLRRGATIDALPTPGAEP